MQIDLIARTEVTPNSLIHELMEVDMESSDGEDLIEFAGRSCYQSFHKPREETRANSDYIANVIRQGHESVLEHASVSFYVQMVSRNLLLELERHRHLSFSVISQRFVDSSGIEYVIPPALEHLANDESLEDSEVVRAISKAVIATQEAYSEINAALIDLPRKERHEAARSILPGGVETRFVVTGNLRAWRDVLKKRYSVHADAEIARFAEGVLLLLTQEHPSVFVDFPQEPFSD